MSLYNEITNMYNGGFSARQISQELGIARNTVAAYLSKTPRDMEVWLASTAQRRKSLDVHEKVILGWLQEHPGLSGAQVCDWLEEKNYGQYAESTVRRYVNQMRLKYKIPKRTKRRDYEAVPELPMGLQAQMDFGQTHQLTPSGKRIRLFFFCLVLSHSRFKYVEWQEGPFKTENLIRCLRNAFSFMHGKPKEIVFDQDNIMVVDENLGEFVYTAEFLSFTQSERLTVRPCRGADPESKGKIENTVQFVKKSFANERVFSNIDEWNGECHSWLKRRGNGRRHNATKKVPADVFAIEQTKLMPYRTTTQVLPAESNPNLRTVRKDNTVMYKSNRYSVPLGTYRGGESTQVALRIKDAKLRIFSVETGAEIASHEVASGQGKLVQSRQHRRDRSAGIEQQLSALAEMFDNVPAATAYLNEIRKKYTRYCRDQFAFIKNLFDDYGRGFLTQVLIACAEQHRYGANEFRDMADLLDTTRAESDKAIQEAADVPLSDDARAKIAGIHPAVRSLDVYTDLIEGEINGRK